MYKLLIATTDPTCLTWQSLPSKKKAIQEALSTVQNGDFFVEVQGVYVKPQVKDGRITHEWFNSFSYPLYRKGYDLVLLHMGMEQKTKWGIQPSLRGASQIDDDFVGEMYAWADENTLRNGLNQFIETICHEVRHELLRGQNDDTHELHAKGTITTQFSQIDMKKYLPQRAEIASQLSVVEKLINDFTLKTRPYGLQPRVYRQAKELLRSMELLGMPMRITEGYRSISRQNDLYAQGRTKVGNIVTNARGGQSLHQYGVAVDFVFLKGYDVPQSHWNTFGTVAESKGFEWGGSWTFKDMPHVEMTLGYSLSDFMKRKVDYNKYK